MPSTQVRRQRGVGNDASGPGTEVGNEVGQFLGFDEALDRRCVKHNLLDHILGRTERIRCCVFFNPGGVYQLNYALLSVIVPWRRPLAFIKHSRGVSWADGNS